MPLDSASAITDPREMMNFPFYQHSFMGGYPFIGDENYGLQHQIRNPLPPMQVAFPPDQQDRPQQEEEKSQ